MSLYIPWWENSDGHFLGLYFSRNSDISGHFWAWPSLVNYHSLQPFWSILAHTQGSQCVIFKSTLKSLARLFTLWKQTKQRFTTCYVVKALGWFRPGLRRLSFWSTRNTKTADKWLKLKIFHKARSCMSKNDRKWRNSGWNRALKSVHRNTLIRVAMTIQLASY